MRTVKVNSETALQSREFAQAMAARAQIFTPDLDLLFFGTQELQGVKQHIIAKDENTSRIYFDSMVADLAKQSISISSAGAFGLSDHITTFISIEEEMTAHSIFQEEFQYPSEDLFISPDVDMDFVKNTADHETFHAKLHNEVFTKTKGLELHPNKDYNGFLHECGADLFSILSAVHDGANPEESLNIIALQRSLSVLSHADLGHFTTPALDAYKEDILENIEGIRASTKAELLESTLEMLLGKDIDPENITKNALFSEEEYLKIKESLQIDSDERRLGENKDVTTLLKSKNDFVMNTFVDASKNINNLSPQALVQSAKSMEDGHARQFIEKYIEPYAHTVQLRTDIIKGFSEPLPTAQLSEGEELFLTFRDEFLEPLTENSSLKEINDNEFELTRFDLWLEKYSELIGLEEEEINQAKNAKEYFVNYSSKKAEDISLEQTPSLEDDFVVEEELSL